MITIHKENNIRISGLPLKYKNHLKKTLSIVNPSYQKILRITHGNRWAAQAFFKYYEDDGEMIVVPRGLHKRLMTWLDKCKLEYEFTEKLVHKKLDNSAYV